ncbi:MAG TPA: response regulator transcription factor [Rhodanobacteraceae bacterium]|nr:response regulator transcription factor [Rhodanobacteraceae bacterium]
MSNNVYIVEDNDRMRALLRDWIDELPGLSVCGAAATAETALEEVPGLHVDLAVIDMSLPAMGGIELVAALLEREPRMCCLILSGHNEKSYVERALAAGAQGYLLKGEPGEIENAITRVLSGGQYLSASLKNSGVGSERAR